MATTTKNQRTISVLEQETNLQTWADAFLVDRRVGGCSKGTLGFYKEKLAKFLYYCDAQLINNVLEITPNIIRQYLLYLEDVGHNPGGVHAHFRTLRTFLNWWENEFEPDGWKNPIRKVKAPKLAIEPLEPVELENVKAMLSTCEKGTFFGERDKAILLALMDTGARAQEFVNINIEDVDLVTGAILIRHGKGGKPRMVFLGKKSRKALRAYLKRRHGRDNALWVGKSGERLTYWGLRQIIRRRAAQAGTPEPGLHDFRRAFCLSQLQAGVPETTIARLMGHTSTQLIARYARQTGKDIREHYHSPIDGMV